MNVPWGMPEVGDAELAEVVDALRGNRLTMGTRVARFEDAIAEMVQVRHAVAVSNGTVALDLALDVLGVGPDDTVAIPAMSYIATLTAVLRRGARPVFVDIDPITLNIDPEDLERKLTPETRCILPIDYGGNPADHATLRTIADRHGIPIALDGAQSLGGEFEGQPLNSFGDVGTMSFHAAKPMTTVEGGMVLTDDDATARRLRVLRNQGEDPERKYHHTELGVNARMTDIAAAIGIRQLPQLPDFLAARREVAARYTRRLRQHEEIRLPVTPPGRTNGWLFYPVRIEARDRVSDELRDAGIDTRTCYPMPLYRQPVFARFGSTESSDHGCPIAEHVTGRVLNLPMFPSLSETMQDHVCETLLRCLG